MWAFSSAILAVFSAILISTPWVSSASVQENFLQCLLSKSQPNFPISEAILTPNNSSFFPVLNFYARNLRFQTPTTPKPLVIVTATHESHVQSTVICAKSVGLEIRIRSGGHDYEGLSYVSHQPFVVLDLSNLQAINVDIANESAWVQSGATVGELYYAIANRSKVHAFPAGVCPTLGTGGHFSGGGYGNLMRKYGLSVDNIVDALIVNVEGEILNRQQMGEDLFWAIRGGGGASFGVILSWKIKLVSVPKTVTVFEVERKLEDGAEEAVWEWQEVADKLDENAFIRMVLHATNGKNGEKSVKASFMAMFLGPAEGLLQLVNQNIPSLKLKKEDCSEMSWIKSVLYWANFVPVPEALLNRTRPAAYLKRKSDYVNEPITKEGIDSIFKAIMEVGKVGLDWNPYGGKMSQISAMATPFPHRCGSRFKIQYTVNWVDGSVEETNRNINLTRRLYELMGRFASKNPREAFLNYRDIDVGSNVHGSLAEGRVYGAKYFKGNFERLVRVKTKVDPQNFFRNEQSIPTL